MPSPVGHLLAGVAVAWTVAPRAGVRVTATAALLAAAADLDLLLPVQHRTVTHSITAVALVTIFATLVTRQVTGESRARFAAVCAGACASHLLLDWLGPDPVFPYGLQALWPFSDRFYISGWDVFRPTARTGIFSRATMVRNLTAAAQELALLGPIVVALWLVRVKTLARLSAKMTGGDHPPE
jgi:membrane-bound metal-dependent hydrolase YbcI (DUF457 family)